MTLREQITLAVLARLTGVDGLPEPVRGEDDPRAAVYVPVNADAPSSAQHFLALLDEGLAPREGCPPVLGAGGVLYDWNLKLIAAYSVKTTDASLRKAQRDVGIGALAAALLLSDLPEPVMRQLDGLANWMWVEPVELRNDVYDGDVQLAVARIPVTVWFTASDPAA